MQGAAFSFGEQLEKALHNAKWSDTLTLPPTNKPTDPDRTLQTPVHRFEEPHSCVSLLEMESHLYYLMACPSDSSSFALCLYSFSKEDGSHTHMRLEGFKGNPHCIEIGLGEWDQEMHIMGLVGLKDGSLKVVELTSDRKKIKKSFYNHKLEQKNIIQVILEERELRPRNICWVLIEDCKVMLFNFRSRVVVAVYQPPMLPHDIAVALTIHPSGSLFASASRSGQIVVWALKEEDLEAIEMSEQKVIKQNGVEESGIEEHVWKFKAKDRRITVFPKLMLHSASIDGLKWIHFMGDLIALISGRGMFKIIAVDFEQKDQFISLIEYPIQHGEAVTQAQIFPLEQTLVIFKGSSYRRLITPEEASKSKDNKTPKSRAKNLANPQHGSLLSRNCVEELKGPSHMELIRFSGKSMKVIEVERRVLEVEGKKVTYNCGIISRDLDFLLASEEKGFVIGKID